MTTPSDGRRGARHTPRDAPAGARACGEDGISLVEVLIAIFVLAVGIMALISVATASMSSLSRSEARQDAYTAASRSIEMLRSYRWDEVAHPSNPFTPSSDTFDPDNGTIDTPGSGENVVVDANGLVAGEPHTFDDGRLNVLTIVTRLPAGGEEGAERRRITVLVEFGTGERAETVRQSTVVTEATWGIAQPTFAVSPINAVLAVERGHEDCITHTVTNQGSTDRYRFQLPLNTNIPGFEPVTSVEIIEPDDTTYTLAIDAAPFTHYTEFYGPPGDDPGEPDFDSFSVRICYEALPSSAEGFTDVELLVESENNPDRSQQLLHTVDIEEERTYWLYDGDGTHRPLSTDPVDADDEAEIILSVGQSATWRTELSRFRTPQEARLELHTASWFSGYGSSSGLVFEVTLRDVDDDEVLYQGLCDASGEWNRQIWQLPADCDDVSSNFDTAIEAGHQLELEIGCAADNDPEPVTEFDEDLGEDVVVGWIDRDCALRFASQTFDSLLWLEFPQQVS